MIKKKNSVYTMTEICHQRCKWYIKNIPFLFLLEWWNLLICKANKCFIKSVPEVYSGSGGGKFFVTFGFSSSPGIPISENILQNGV